MNRIRPVGAPCPRQCGGRCGVRGLQKAIVPCNMRRAGMQHATCSIVCGHACNTGVPHATHTMSCNMQRSYQSANSETTRSSQSESRNPSTCSRLAACGMHGVHRMPFATRSQLHVTQRDYREPPDLFRPPRAAKSRRRIRALAPPTSAPGLGSPRPHLHRDRARPAHICTGNGLAPPTSAPGLGSPRPHLHRDLAHPAHICTGTGLF